MCTVLVSLRPGAAWPVLVLAVRDEMLGRPWRDPAAHWPRQPGLLGGLDEQAGGTWLAVDSASARIACVLNATGRPATPARRRSRGELPLRAAAGQATPGEATRYDPFHLLTIDVGTPTSAGGAASVPGGSAGAGGLCVTTWNGHQPHRYRLGAGDHLFVNQGRWLGPADRRSPRAAFFGPRFAVAPRPDPAAPAPVAVAWAPWLDLLDGPDLPPPADPRALVVRSADQGDGVWGTSSVTLLGRSASGELRYDFRAGPEADRPWQRIVAARATPRRR